MNRRQWIVALVTIVSSLEIVVVNAAAAPSIDATGAADFELLAAIRSAATAETDPEEDRMEVAASEIENETIDDDDEHDSSSTVVGPQNSARSLNINSKHQPSKIDPATNSLQFFHKVLYDYIGVGFMGSDWLVCS
ncbi:hypothetical protein QAD02_010681 [Eretmocerus hayati]|uniref:Uncharacterized protein n=1 Tax=Eretmocerus hayati TaxID=131215 RepID=A0ACC2NZB9_9HYME|nr:hypothetical protein QAD02_010681 [Eretmocerus hayati]